jgi:uncharacterized membrane protein
MVGATQQGLPEKKEVALMMRRILLVVAVGAILVLSSVSYAFAEANPNNNGNAESAPGQEIAEDNCNGAIAQQGENDVSAGGGPKEDVSSPTNCDHFFQLPE